MSESYSLCPNDIRDAICQIDFGDNTSVHICVSPGRYAYTGSPDYGDVITTKTQFGNITWTDYYPKEFSNKLIFSFNINLTVWLVSNQEFVGNLVYQAKDICIRIAGLEQDDTRKSTSISFQLCEWENEQKRNHFIDIINDYKMSRGIFSPIIF